MHITSSEPSIHWQRIDQEFGEPASRPRAATVDRLQALGVLTVGHDPADGRRTLVSVHPQTRHLDFADRAERPIADAIRQVVAGVSGEQHRVEAALEVLGDELLDRSPGPPPARPAGRRRAQKSGRGPMRPQGSPGHPAIRATVALPAPNDYPDPDE